MKTLHQSAPASVKSYSLYHYDSCPYCQMTRKVLDKTGVDIELRNIQTQPHHRAELIKGGGKAQVPSLRIDLENGESQWLYESADIIHYFNSYGQEYQAANSTETVAA